MEVSKHMKNFILNRLSATTVVLVVISALAGYAVRAQGNPDTLNVYVSSPALPEGLKRVVVLPLACEQSSGDLLSGRETLDPVLEAALVKAGKFEVVEADPETLRSCSGKLSWTGQEELPVDFFSNLQHVYGCDGVLFCELTVFRPSPPIAIGWRLKLVDAQKEKILWAADEIFDSANLPVAKDAQSYEKGQQPHHSVFYNVYSFLAWCINTPTRSALDEQWNILHSPRYFGQYSAEKLLKTLPTR